MYALQFFGGPRLDRLDPVTGLVLQSSPLTAFPPATQTRLAWQDPRLYIMGNLGNVDRLIRCHPADGGEVHLPPVGTRWELHAIDIDPTTGIAHAIAIDRNTFIDYYAGTVDLVTGAFSVGPPVTPPGNWISMAIDASGNILLAKAAGQQYFALDPVSGVTSFVGATAIPNSLCYDLAYDETGRLWGTFHDALNGANSGIYQIDTTTWTTSLFLSTPSAYFGLAFGHGTDPVQYCSSKLSSLGCLPRLDGSGFASPTASLGFTVTASDLNNNRVGMLLYSTNGRATIPFQGGLLCVQTPVQRSPAGTTGGNALPSLDCSGSWSIDYNAMIWSKFPNTISDPAVLPPLLTPGTTVQCQWWGRDPGFAAPNNSMLSDGLEFVLSP